VRVPPAAAKGGAVAFAKIGRLAHTALLVTICAGGAGQPTSLYRDPLMSTQGLPPIISGLQVFRSGIVG